MSLRTSATRYAKALLEIAIRESDPLQVERDLAGIVGAMNESADLRRALMSPAVTQAGQVKVARAIGEAAGVQPPVAKLLVLLAERGRLDLLPDLLDVYRERLNAHRQIVEATITSAAPLPADTVQALEARLSALTGKTVQVNAGVDPSIIGGVITRIGSTVYDGSIRTQLRKMRQQLVEQA